MHNKLVPLKAADHSAVRLQPLSDYRFASGELVAPIVVDEIADVAREYPIVFPVGSALPVALMGLEKGANAYVSPDGQWRAAYIPAHIRHYPMAITRLPEAKEPAAEQAANAAKGAEKGKKGKARAQAAQAAAEPNSETRFAVLLDIESPYVSSTEGEPIFDSKGRIVGLAQQKLRIIELLQNRAGITASLVRAIDKAGLLVERAIRIKRAGEPDRQVAGLRVIDEAALNKLDDRAFGELRKSGALPLVYASLLSWANFRQGPIGKSHPLPTPGDLSLDDLFVSN